MGQGASKRQSYTPGETKDAGLPSGPIEVNGEVKTGANGQVELLSNKEMHGGSVTDTSSAPVTPTTSSSSPTSPKARQKYFLPLRSPQKHDKTQAKHHHTSDPLSQKRDKKKKKTPRFVFSLKRTGSGKRSRKAKNEANGVRPVSYPSPTPAGQADKNNARPQSLFLEEIPIPEEDDGKIETVSLSSNDDHKEKKKESGGKSSARKASSSFKPSSPKAKNEKDKKKGDSQKKKNSKKKEKEAKRQKKEEEKEKTRKVSVEEKEKREQNRVVEENMNEAVAKMEELSPPEHTTPEASVAGAGASAEVKLEISAETNVVTEVMEVHSKQADTEAAPEKSTTELESPKVDSLEAGAECSSPEDTKLEDAAGPDGRVEAVIEVTMATVANSAASISHEDTAGEPPEVKEIGIHSEEITEQQHAAVSELIIANGIHTEQVSTWTKAEEEKELTLTEETAAHSEELLSSTVTPPVDELKGKITQEKDEDEPVVVESITVLFKTEEEHVEANKGEASVVCSTHAIKKDAAAVEEVVGETTVLDLQSAPAAVQPELTKTEETIQKTTEVSVESVPSGHVVVQATGSEATPEAAKFDLTENEVHVPVAVQSQSEVAAAAAVVVDVSSPEGTSAAAATPEADSLPQPLSPTQLKALEKEIKLVKKREEKEKARKEKEEKKRLKEQKKREAREKKQKEKEEKERMVREAREKLKETANMTVEVPAKPSAQPGAQPEAQPAGYVKVVETTFTASCSTKAQAAPRASAAEQSQTPSSAEPVLNVELRTTEKLDIEPVTNKDRSSDKDAENKDAPDGGVLGSSVKDIISSIEHSAVNSSEAPAKPADDTQPPAVPSSPYPDEEDEPCPSPSGSSVASSPVSTVSPCSSAPQSPAAVEVSPKTPISPETGESARPGHLRKIELGPRLRTAILRKSSSGAESEEKRVSLTVPRHVQVSDLTPPPRKQGPRRPLQQAWSPLGAYSARSPQRLVHQPAAEEGSAVDTPQEKEPEPVTEEVVAIASAVNVEAAPHAESQALCSDEKADEENATAAETPEADPSSQECKEYSVMTELATPGSRVSLHADPESPTIVSVASIVLGAEEQVQGPVSDMCDPPYLPPDADTTSGSQEDAVVVVEEVCAKPDGEVQPQPSEGALQKMAADLVSHVQQAAQKEAAATAQVAPGDSVDVGVTCEVSDCDVKGDVENSVHCSAELVEDSTDCSVVNSNADSCVSSSAELTESAAALIVDDVHKSSEGKDTMESLLNCSRDDAVSVNDCQQPESECSEQPSQPSHSELSQTEGQICEAVSALSEPATTVFSEAVSGEVCEEKQADPEDDKEELSTSTLSSEIEADLDEKETVPLQQVHKNYCDITVVVGGNYNDGDEAATETHDKLQCEEVCSDAGSTEEQERSVTVTLSADDDSFSTHNSREKVSNGEVVVSLSDEAAQNGDASSKAQKEEEEGEDEQHQQQVNGGDENTESETVTITTRCNGSHVELADSNNETIDAYLKLQTGGGVVVGDGKKLAADALEANNKSSGEKTESSSDQTESTSSCTAITIVTNDSTNESVG